MVAELWDEEGFVRTFGFISWRESVDPAIRGIDDGLLPGVYDIPFDPCPKIKRLWRHVVFRFASRRATATAYTFTDVDRHTPFMVLGFVTIGQGRGRAGLADEPKKNAGLEEREQCKAFDGQLNELPPGKEVRDLVHLCFSIFKEI